MAFNKGTYDLYLLVYLIKKYSVPVDLSNINIVYIFYSWNHPNIIIWRLDVYYMMMYNYMYLQV